MRQEYLELMHIAKNRGELGLMCYELATRHYYGGQYVEAVANFRYAASAEYGEAVALFKGAPLPGNAGEMVAKIITEVQCIAEEGAPPEQRAMGIIYRYGFGTAVSVPKAIDWFTKAAAAWDAEAAFQLGHIYWSGAGGTQKNTMLGVEYFLKSANLGNAAAQLMVSDFYLAGNQGLTRDLVEHVIWLTLYARQTPEGSATRQKLATTKKMLKPAQLAEVEKRLAARG